MKKRNQLLAALAVALMAGPIIAQAEYDYQTIDYPGASDTQVFGINARGDVVGNGFVDPDLFPFIYDTETGTFTNVAPVAGYDATAVLGISDSGFLVGSVTDDDPFRESGLVLDRNGSATVFDHPDALSITQARAVNSKGLVTGSRDSVDDQFFPENGFIYDPKSDTFTDIVPSLFTIAQGITSKGDVVGSAIFFTADDPCPPSAGETVRYGWLRTADGAVIYFDVNGRRTSARGITRSGTIAGFVSDAGTVDAKGFVVDLDGSQCQSITIAEGDMLAPPGAVQTFVQGIKNSGEVVGWYSDGTNNHGFIATPR